MHNKKINRVWNNIIAILVIGLSFLWTGSAFLSWVYNVAALLEPINRIDLLELLTEGVGYVFQALGILIFSLFIKHYLISTRVVHSADILLKATFLIVSLTDVMITFICMNTAVLSTALIFGYIQNILHGIIAAMYIYMLTLYVEIGRRGIVFGVGYSIGSIGSYLISLINSGNFLRDIRCIQIYISVTVVTIILIYTCIFTEASAVYKIFTGKADAPDNPADEADIHNVAIHIIVLATAVVILLSLVKGLGFYFDFSDVWTGGMSLEYTRMYYAIGLLLAGIINDINRRWGGILCVAALVFPFVLILLNSASVSGTVLWIINYSITGLYVVYRVLLFSDIAWESLIYKPLSKGKSLLFIAPFGLMFGRIGDFISTVIGIKLSSSPIILNSITAIIFVITVIVFLALFTRLYLGEMAMQSNNFYAEMASNEQSANSETSIGFSDYYGLTDREMLVLYHITNRLTNKEIAAELFVQESTVKYHVKNILRKTGCSNRKELLTLYEGYKH